MTLESAVKSLVKSLLEWVEVHKDKEAHMIINFSSLFIHYAKSMLKNTHEFKENYKLSNLKNRFVSFDFENGRLKYVEWAGHPRLNELIKQEINNYYSEKTDLTENFNIKNVLNSENSIKGLLDLQSIDNFKF